MSTLEQHLAVLSELGLDLRADITVAVEVAKSLCALAGAPDALENIEAHLDHDDEEAWIQYTAAGKQCRHELEVIGDWMDGEAIGQIGWDIGTATNKRFYMLPGGQSQLVFCMTEAAAQRLRSLGASI